jgi:hypothetical protein
MKKAARQGSLFEGNPGSADSLNTSIPPRLPLVQRKKTEKRKISPRGGFSRGGEVDRQLELFEAGLPRYLYAADDFSCGLYRWPKIEALTKRFVEANPGKLIRTLTYDIDRPGAAHDWSLRDAPAPSITVENRENGHAHAIYLLSWPVLKVVDGDPKSRALRYTAAVQEALRQRLDADPSYSGLMVKNPRSNYWGVLTWWDYLYDLDALAAKVERELETLTDRRRRLPDIGLGRNDNLFRDLARWGQGHVSPTWGTFDDWHQAVRARCAELNACFPCPLPVQEVRSISKSVTRWTWERRESFAEGRRQWHVKGGLARARARQADAQDKRQRLLDLRAQVPAVSIRSLARIAGLPETTARRLVRHKHYSGTTPLLPGLGESVVPEYTNGTPRLSPPVESTNKEEDLQDDIRREEPPIGDPKAERKRLEAAYRKGRRLVAKQRRENVKKLLNGRKGWDG